MLTFSARLQRRKDGSNKKVHFAAKVRIAAQATGGGPTTALRNSPTIAGIDVNSGLLRVGWLVVVATLTIGHAIREHISTLLSTLSFNLGHISHHLPIISPKSPRRHIDRMYRLMDSIGAIARLHMLKGD